MVRPSSKLTAEEIADAVPQVLGYRKLVTMREDDCQIYRQHSSENLARMRQAKVIILKREPSKLNLKRKRRRAAMNSTYLEKLINA